MQARIKSSQLATNFSENGELQLKQRLTHLMPASCNCECDVALHISVCACIKGKVRQARLRAFLARSSEPAAITNDKCQHLSSPCMELECIFSYVLDRTSQKSSGIQNNSNCNSGTVP